MAFFGARKEKKLIKDEFILPAVLVWEDATALRVVSTTYPLPVSVVSGGGGGGGGGGGLAQIQVRNSDNVWTDVGYATDNLNMPVEIKVALPAGTNNIGDVDVLTYPGPSSDQLPASLTVGGNLKVAVQESITLTVQATNLDIRNLVKTQDEVYSVLRTDTGVAYDARDRNWTITEQLDISDRALRDMGKIDIAGFDVSLPAGTNIIGAVKDAGVDWTPVHKTGQYTTAQTNTILWAPAAGKKFVITDFIVSTDTAMTITLKDGTATIYEWYFAANGGAVSNLRTPYYSTAANNNLTITTSAEGKVSISVEGYEV